MNTQMNETTVGAQARVNNFSKAVLMLDDMAYQAEHDALLDAMCAEELACQAEHDALMDAMYAEELACQAEYDAMVGIVVKY